MRPSMTIQRIKRAYDVTARCKRAAVSHAAARRAARFAGVLRRRFDPAGLDSLGDAHPLSRFRLGRAHNGMRIATLPWRLHEA